MIKKILISEAIKMSGFKAPFVIQRSGIKKGRFYRLCKGAKPYLHEAQKLSTVLGKPIHELFQDTK